MIHRLTNCKKSLFWEFQIIVEIDNFAAQEAPKKSKKNINERCK